MNSNSPIPGNTLATNSLERGLAVMRTIGRQRGGMTHAELSRSLEIPKSTCTYILKRLEQEGFVVRNKATGRYKIGLDILPLAHNAVLEVELLSLAKPVLGELARSTGLLAILCVQAGDRVLAIDCVEGSPFLSNSVEQAPAERWPASEPCGVGSEYALHSSAVGKVLLAYSRQRDLANAGRPCAHPAGRIAGQSPRATECDITELEHIRERGYAIRERQSSLDPFCIAAPVFDSKGNVRFSLCIQESVPRPAHRDVGGWIGLLKKASQKISKSLQTLPVNGEISTDRADGCPDPRSGREDKTGLSGFSRTQQPSPPGLLNQPVLRPAYLTAARRHGFSPN